MYPWPRFIQFDGKFTALVRLANYLRFQMGNLPENGPDILGERTTLFQTGSKRDNNWFFSG